MVTIKDVAKLAGVSVSTVSIVLNTTMEDRRVSPTTWKKVQNAITTLNYKPSTAARKLRKNTKETAVIGVFWPNRYHQASLLGETLFILQNAFDRSYFDCNIVIYMFSPEHLQECSELTEGELLDGAIIGLASTADLEWLEQETLKLPVVLFNRQVKTCNFVRSDNCAMGRKAAQLLLAAGDRSAALFHIQKPSRGIEKRLNDFKEVYCQSEGTQCREYVFDIELNFEGIIHQTQKMLNAGSADCVVYFTNEQAAYSSIYHMIKQQVRVPEDVKAVLVGVTFNNLSRYISPTLTLIASSGEQMLFDCAQILIHQIKEPEILPIQKIYTPEIIYGETFPQYE